MKSNWKWINKLDEKSNKNTKIKVENLKKKINRIKKKIKKKLKETIKEKEKSKKENNWLNLKKVKEIYQHKRESE